MLSPGSSQAKAMRNLLGFIPAAHPTPRVILGLDPGICNAAIEHRRSGLPRVSTLSLATPAKARVHGPFHPPQSIGDAAGSKGGGDARYNTYPRFHDLTHTPSHEPAFMDASATNVWREVGRKSGDRFSGSPNDLPTSVGSGSLRVAAGKAQSGQMAGRGARRSTSYRGNPEGHLNHSWFKQTPARDAAISQKPRMRGAMIASYKE